MFPVHGRRLRCRRTIRRVASMVRSRPGRCFAVLVALLLALWLVYRLLGVAATQSALAADAAARRASILASYSHRRMEELRHGGQIPMCRAPALRVLNASDSGVYGPGLELKPCADREPLLLLAANRLVLNRSHPLAANLSRCRVRGIEWRTDDEAVTTHEQEFKPGELGVRVFHDFVLARCEVRTSGGETRDVHQVLVQASPKDLVHKRIVEQRQFVAGHRRPDVLIVVIGDVDVERRRLELPKTSAYLDILKAIDIPGLTGLSYNVMDNVIPLLTGRYLHELPNARRGTTSAQYVDVFNFLWYDFEKHGYATLLAEDTAMHTVFNKELHGFEQRPTDHYMRPFWLEMDQSECVHGRHRHEYTFDFVRDFFFNYHNVSKLAMLVHHPGREGNPRSVAALDEPLARLLATLSAAGDEHNLVLLLLGVPRLPSTLEALSRPPETTETLRRLALGQIVLPTWFKVDQRAMAENLVRSTGQMVTFFDLNRLVRDLLQVGAKEPQLGPARDVHAHSLLREMIREKTCASAGVPLPWCTCVRKDRLQRDDREALQAARHLVGQLNRLTEPYRSHCESLGMAEVIYADLFTPKTKDTIRVRDGPVQIRKEAKITSYYFHLVLKVNKATIAGVVGLDKLSGTFNTFTESVVRFRENDHSCIEDQRIKEFCVCRY